MNKSSIYNLYIKLTKYQLNKNSIFNNTRFRSLFKAKAPKDSVSKSSTHIEDILESMIPLEMEKFQKAKKQYGTKKVGEINFSEITSDMKNIATLIHETSHVDPEKGILFRNYSLPELYAELPKFCGGCEPMPESVFWLMLTGQIPSAEQAASLSKEWSTRANSLWTKQGKFISKLMDRFPIEMHPITQLSMTVMALGRSNVFCECCQKGVKKEHYWKPFYEDCMNLISILPILAAKIYNNTFRYERGKYKLNSELDWAGNLSCMLGYDTQYFHELMRMYLTIHSDDNGGDVLSHTAHLVGSGLNDAYTSYAAALSSLSGYRSGSESEKFITFLQNYIKENGKRCLKVERVQEFADRLLNCGSTVPGFGHSILKKTDPRYVAQMDFVKRNDLINDPLVKLVQTFSNVLPSYLKSNGKMDNPNPNTNALSGVLFYQAGLKQTQYYAVLLGISRALGALSSLIWDRIYQLPMQKVTSIQTDWIEDKLKSSKEDKKTVHTKKKEEFSRKSEPDLKKSQPIPNEHEIELLKKVPGYNNKEEVEKHSLSAQNKFCTEMGVNPSEINQNFAVHIDNDPRKLSGAKRNITIQSTSVPPPIIPQISYINSDNNNNNNNNSNNYNNQKPIKENKENRRKTNRQFENDFKENNGNISEDEQQYQSCVEKKSKDFVIFPDAKSKDCQRNNRGQESGSLELNAKINKQRENYQTHHTANSRNSSKRNRNEYLKESSTTYEIENSQPRHEDKLRKDDLKPNGDEFTQNPNRLQQCVICLGPQQDTLPNDLIQREERYLKNHSKPLESKGHQIPLQDNHQSSLPPRQGEDPANDNHKMAVHFAAHHQNNNNQNNMMPKAQQEHFQNFTKTPQQEHFSAPRHNSQQNNDLSQYQYEVYPSNPSDIDEHHQMPAINIMPTEQQHSHAHAQKEDNDPMYCAKLIEEYENYLKQQNRSPHDNNYDGMNEYYQNYLKQKHEERGGNGGNGGTRMNPHNEYPLRIRHGIPYENVRDEPPPPPQPTQNPSKAESKYPDVENRHYFETVQKKNPPPNPHGVN